MKMKSLLGFSVLILVITVFTFSVWAEKVVLNGIFLGASWGVAAQKLAEEYEKLTGVKVNIELIGRDAIYEKLALEFASRASRYDIFNIDYNWLPQFAGAGHLKSIDEYITPQTELEDFLPKALEITCKWGGKLYGLPQTVHPHLLWYRKDLFENPEYKAEFKEKYGYELMPPQTMQQWRDVAEFFNGRDTNGDGNPDLYGWAAQAAKGYGNVHTWLTFVYCFGGDVFDWETMEPTLTTPEVIEATKFWADMLQFCPPGIHEYTFAEVAKDAAVGRIATALHWSWSSWEVDDPNTSTTLGLWEFAQVPKQVESAPHLAAWSIVVSAYSKHPEEAFKFIEWLENKDNDVRQTLMGGGDPVRISSYSDPRILEAKVEGTDIPRFRRLPEVLKAMETTRPRPLIPQEEQWEIVVSQYLSAIQLGQMSVEEALEVANAQVRMMMERSGYYKQ
ncbi:sugar ABC transporter substrate-binding protein [Thermatribacter velox]|uniref:Sugar ABC transporter substrate-binding protein n=1 Tax=Thermatribacter velox TaxID=3039681 RepID=A0ABZ2YBY6_9BACT